MDRYLDQARCGPSFLKREDIAQIVVNALHHGADTLHYYQLHSYVVMPNHVHALMTPLFDPSKLLRSLRGFTAHETKKILSRPGEPFWQGESYDRLVRDA